MTNQTFPVNSIMAYVGADASVVGVSSTTVLPDWNGDSVWFFKSGLLATDGIRKFDIDTDGDETLQKAKGTIGVSWVYAVGGGAAALMPDASSIVFISDPANSAKYAKVLASDLTLQAQMGAASANSNPSSPPTRILEDVVVEGFESNSDEFALLTANLTGTSGGGEVVTIPVGGFATGSLVGYLDEQGLQSQQAVRGPKGALGTGYVVSPPFQNGIVGAFNSDPLGVYKIFSDGTKSKIGTFDYADIDPTWSKILNVRGCAWDQTDGNIIIGASTNDAVANQNYLAKISTTTGAVLWVCVVASLTAFGWGFAKARVANQRLLYVESANSVSIIDTSDGSKTTSGFTGLAVPTGPQVSDDVTNSLIVFGSFTAGGSPPSYVGTYMGTLGNHTVFNKWLRVWLASSVPPVPGGGRRWIAESGPVG